MEDFKFTRAVIQLLEEQSKELLLEFAEHLAQDSPQDIVDEESSPQQDDGSELSGQSSSSMSNHQSSDSDYPLLGQVSAPPAEIHEHESSDDNLSHVLPDDSSLSEIDQNSEASQT